MVNALIITFLLVLPWAILRLIGVGAAWRGRLGLALVLLFTGTGHFLKTEAMTHMLPDWVPARTELVWISGIFEIALAVALLIPRQARRAGMVACAFLILVLPVNVYAAWMHVDFGGHSMGPAYLWIRFPLQLLLIAWAWWFAVRAHILVTESPNWNEAKQVQDGYK